MVTVATQFHTNVGMIVLNLASRKCVVTVGVEDSVFGGQTLYLRVTKMKGDKSFTLRETIHEKDIEKIVDPTIIADAIFEKLSRQK